MKRVHTAVLACLILALPSTVGLSQAQASPAGTHQTITVTASNPDGSPAVNARVAIYAFPARLTTGITSTTFLGDATANDNGVATVQLEDAQAVRAATMDDGQLHLAVEITGSRGVASYSYYTPAPPVTATRATAISAAEASVDSSLSLQLAPISGLTKPGLVSRAPLALTSATTLNCPTGYFTQYLPTNEYTTATVRLQQLHTLTKTTVSYNWSNSKNTEMGVSWEYVGGDGGIVKINGGMKKSITVSSGTPFSAGTSKNVWAAVEWQYRRYNKWCTSSSPYGGAFYTNTWQWWPNKWTGGNSYPSTTSSFTCYSTHRISIVAPIWVARATSRTISGGVTVRSLSLAVKQTNSEEHRLDYRLTGSKAYLCGDIDYPIWATKVREVSS